MMRMLRLGGPFRDTLPAQLDASAKNHHIDYALHASVFNDAQISQMGFCVEKGITSFKIYMNLGGEVGPCLHGHAARLLRACGSTGGGY